MTPPASVLLLWGEDAFLLREAAQEPLSGFDVTEVDAAAWRGGELQDLATPALFGAPRALVVSDARSLSKDAAAELAAYVAAPAPGSMLVVSCVVAERGKPPAALLKMIEPAGEVRRVQLARKDVDAWVAGRAKRVGVDLTVPGARALVATIGPDAAQLDAAVSQLVAAFGGVRVGPAEVHRQFRGLGEQKTWDLCDKAFGKDLAGAIRALRSIEEAGDEAIMVLGGIASRLRDMIRVRSLPDRIAPAELARQAGAVRLAGAPLPPAGEELLPRGAGAPARPGRGGRPGAEVGRDRRHRHAHADRRDRGLRATRRRG
jgi:DNA polymerase-3 subunit delta